MPRPPRAAEGGLIYHVLNRANARLTIFDSDEDYVAFERVLAQAVARFEIRLLAYGLMADHFHLLLWPRGDGDLSGLMRWVTVTHTQRWHASHGTVGTGHLYQGRFKSFPVQPDDHFLAVCRHVEGNALRAGLVERAEDWSWSSLAPARGRRADERPALSAWPIERPRNWKARVNRPVEPEEEEAIVRSIQRGRPFGSEPWQAEVSTRLGLESTFRPRGRPRKQLEGGS